VYGEGCRISISLAAADPPIRTLLRIGLRVRVVRKELCENLFWQSRQLKVSIHPLWVHQRAVRMAAWVKGFTKISSGEIRLPKLGIVVKVQVRKDCGVQKTNNIVWKTDIRVVSTQIRATVLEYL